MASSSVKGSQPTDWVEDAVAIANVPTLLLLLTQLTGDLSWIEPPYVATRAKGLSDNDDGGLSEVDQASVRAAAVAAIRQWQNDGRVEIPTPDEDLLLRMLGASMGEEIPHEYAAMIAAELSANSTDHLPRLDADPPEGFRVLVIGAGVSGLCAAVYLKAAGIAFTVIERNDDVGGTWLTNTYPAAGVDTPNHLYSYSFAPYPWTRFFSLQGELHAYLNHVADEQDLRSNIRLNTEVLRAVYSEAEHTWQVEVKTPAGTVEVLTADIVLSAVGAFNPPVIPKIPGLSTFAGLHFHSAEWPSDLDITGKNVAIIGTGASSMQIVPAIAARVGSLVIFQREPQWAAPFEKFQKVVPPEIQKLLAEVPLYRLWYRVRLGWTYGDRLHASLHKDPDWTDKERSLNAVNDGHRQYFERYIRSEIGDRSDLLERVIPRYPPYGKRMLLDNGWFRTLTRENVELVTDRVVEVCPDGLITDTGERYPVDILVFATGFDVVHFVDSYEVRGRGGRTLREAWNGDDCKAHLGLAVAGFPNFFTLYGPNTQPGHGGSLIALVEAQMNYIMDILRQMLNKNLHSVEVKKASYDRWAARVDAAHEKMVWTHQGMSTYYRNSKGRVVVNTPFRIIDTWHESRGADLNDFEVET